LDESDGGELDLGGLATHGGEKKPPQENRNAQTLANSISSKKAKQGVGVPAAGVKPTILVRSRDDEPLKKREKAVTAQ